MAGVHRARHGLLALSSRLAAWQQQTGGSLGNLLAGVYAPEQSLARQATPVLSRLTSLIPSLADMAWLAVPKRKVTPHRKGNRSASKHIRFVPVVARCSKCDRVFQQHQMPSKCEQDDCPAFSLRRRPDEGSEE